MNPGERLRPSATVILVRSKPELEVYLVERGRETRFFPGYHAFPGGVLDKEDGEADGARRRAALRELHEETGVKVAESALIDAGHLVTPPFGPTRYDTSFFVAEVPSGQDPQVTAGELVSGRWWTPRAALTEWEEKAMPIPPPTLAYLRLLDAHKDARKAAEAARATDGRPHHERFRIEIHPGVYVLPLRAPTLPPATTQNCYLFDGDPILVVDPGTPHEEERVALFHTLDEMTKDGRDGLIVLTHHHADHVGSVSAVAERYGFRVLATQETKHALGKGIVDGVIGETHVFDLGKWASKPWRIDALATPGHTAGHLALRDTRWNAILAGDLVSGVSTILVDPDEGDMAQYMISLERCAAFDPPLVLPGHGPAMPGSAFRKAIEHRQMREAKVRGALTQELRGLDAIVPKAYDDMPQEAWPLALRSLESILIDMERRGVARRDGDRWASTLWVG